MTEQQTALLVLATIGGAGILLILIGLLIRISAKSKAKKCTAKSTGKVADYYVKYTGGNDFNSSYVGPVVEFRNEAGNAYKAEKKFSGVRISSSSRKTPNTMWEDSKGVLHIVTGRKGLSERAMAEDLWPLGTEMTVYYDPEDPMHNYVEKPTTNRTMFLILTLSGAAIAILGIIAYIINTI